MDVLTYYDWITDTSVDDQGAWSYVPDAGFKKVSTLVHNLVDKEPFNYIRSLTALFYSRATRNALAVQFNPLLERRQNHDIPENP